MFFWYNLMANDLDTFIKNMKNYEREVVQRILDDKVDFCKVAEGLGCKAIRVFASQDIAPALQEAQRLRDEFHVPVVVEIITERVTNIAMGPDINKVTEFEEILDL